MYNKKNEKYITRRDLYFSHIWPNGIYCWNDQSDDDPIDKIGKSRNPLFMDVETDELFRTKKVYWKQNLEEYKYAIKNAPKTDTVIWPVDLVELNNDIVTKVFVEPDYNVHMSREDEEQDTNMVMLFPYRPYPANRTVSSILDGISGKKTQAAFSWKDPRIPLLATSILNLVKNLNDEGYLFLDFDFDRMYMTQNGVILTQYSHLIIRDWEKFPDAPDYVMDLGEYKLDFAMPAVVQGKVTKPSRMVQNYSLAAVLFYLFVGRLPYDGPLIAGHPDRNAQEHLDKFITYHNNPVFIFDETNLTNQLGLLGADRKIIEVWEALPNQIKETFRQILGKGEEYTDVITSRVGAAEWLELVNQLK